MYKIEFFLTAKLKGILHGLARAINIILSIYKQTLSK